MKALVINCSPVRDGATAEIVRLVSEELGTKYDTKQVSIDDYRFDFCRGCRSCHQTGTCVQHDDADLLMREFAEADVIVSVAPSYWADVPGQFKAFIDRCTPWSNTHEPHASLGGGKRGYAVALRTGPNMRECEKLLDTLQHFYGHLDIPCCGRLGMCSVECRDDVAAHREEILKFAAAI